MSTYDLQAQAKEHTRLMNHGYFDRRKNPNTPIETHVGIKDDAGSGISGLYLWMHSDIYHLAQADVCHSYPCERQT